MHQSPPLTPEELNDLFQQACKDHQQGHLAEAKSGYMTLLEYVDAPLLHYNMGLVHFELHDFQDALSSFAKAHAGNPFDSDTLFNLALCQRECGLFDDACTSYHKLIDIEPDHVDAIYNLASCYRATRQDEMAINQYRQLLQQQPEHQSALSNLAYMYQLTGDTENAIRYYRRLLELDPERESARHMLAALLGDTFDAPSESYVRDLFDSYSDHYEQSLVVNLEYHVPLSLREVLVNLPDCPQHFNEGIDLGCGTGLSGESFRDIVEHLDGVDLSAKMIAIAEKKNIYRDLYVDNIATALTRIDRQYDFVLAADVFGYLGDLAPIIMEVSGKTEPDTIFCGSIEAGDIAPFNLQPSGRIAHSPEYFLELVKKHGWSVLQFSPTQLRRERDGWIKGFIWILQKQKEGNAISVKN
ncbi:tetratricopeptide repeat protein [Desulfopila aestuarii]|uniref:Predicted methyltransferase, contains TPR repeat n=1 Tax=Desulfopila aestuarii DSM 18488 TaxID=1121416 RepID=A0A1M7Y1W6_9BACT|nr:tetratricopeptide repeat protein [Desulfopila aestuarii]SHO45848.1 Predicted methyltransferase, contains TPR repeat [Desulfopila aestuarii DSM 18488]